MFAAGKELALCTVKKIVTMRLQIASYQTKIK